MPSSTHKFRKTPRYVRLFNAVGRRAVPPGFKADALIETAYRRTGTEDAGPWALRNGLEKLLLSIEREAQLTASGWLATRSYLVDLLANRLKLASDRKRLPHIQGISISAPLFIVGLPRTGTTLLHGLLAQDPELRAPMTWEVMEPSPPPDAKSFANDSRIARTERRLRWLDRLAPDFKRIHPVGALLPQECIAITTHAFMSIQFHTTCRVPTYQSWLDNADLAPAYRFHHDFLQHLAASMPEKRWVLKAPGHLFGIDALLATYPDATIIQTHRDPLRVVPSIASHTTVLRSAFSDSVDPAEIGADWSRRWARGLDDMTTERDRRDGRGFVDVRYENLVADPISAVRRLYQHLDMPLTATAEAAMRAYLDRWPRNKFGAHRYELADFGLREVAERARFAGYCARYDIQTGNE